MDYSKYFTVSKNDAERFFIKLIDNAPDELRDLIYTIHKKHFFGSLPNDWIYWTIYEAFDDLAKDRLDHINIEADIYNHDLAYWFYDNCNQFAHEYCNEWLEEFGNGCKLDMIEIMRNAQEMAKARIYCEVNDFLQQKESENA